VSISYFYFLIKNYILELKNSVGPISGLSHFLVTSLLQSPEGKEKYMPLEKNDEL
jgi:hypothetical protein